MLAVPRMYRRQAAVSEAMLSEAPSAAFHDLTHAYPTLDQVTPHASAALSHAHSHMGGCRYVQEEHPDVYGSS
jgi:hypothetical protein